MRSLKDILLESKKTYRFKIGIAGELPEKFNERLKTVLEKFSIASLSSGKKTPIQERPLDFPQLQNTEVTYWDVELEYPTTDAVLKDYLGQTCGVHESKVIVRNPDQVADNKDTSESEVYEPLLTKETLEGESAQQSVGSSRVMDLLKELETARKERNNDQSGFKMEANKTEPKNTKSAIGN